MTREESIKLVKEVAGMSLDWDDAHYDALQMAIKALEKEPCEEKTKTKSIPLDRAIREIQKLRGCSCSCSDRIIHDVEDILDKLIESEKSE